MTDKTVKQLWSELEEIMWDIELYNEEIIKDKTIFKYLEKASNVMKEINGLSKIG
jgi:hypothetical protein